MSSGNQNQLEQLLRQLLNPNQQQGKNNEGGNGFQAPAPQPGPVQQQQYQQNSPPANNILQQLGLLGLQQNNGDIGQLMSSALGNLSQQSSGGNQPPPAREPSTDNFAVPPTRRRTEEGTRNPPPGTKMIPCRARRMPMDHNFLNAYFLVPENVKHGEDLVCSFPACRNAGVKFRYCVHCKAPVAKRNFIKRHNHEHGENAFEGSKEDIDDLDDEDDSKVSVKESHTALTKPPPKQHSALIVTDASSRSTRWPSDNSETGRSSLSTQDLKGLAGKNRPDGAETSQVDLLNSDDIRMQRWTQLLQTRPDTMDEKGMSVWIDEVMAVSDFKKPIGPSSSFNPEKRERESSNSDIKNDSKPLKKRKRTESKATKNNQDNRSLKKQVPKDNLPAAASSRRIHTNLNTLSKPGKNTDARPVSDTSNSEAEHAPIKSEKDASNQALQKDGGPSSLNSSSSETQDRSDTVTNSSKDSLNGPHREMTVRQVRFMKGKVPEESDMLSNTSDEVDETESGNKGNNYKISQV